MSLPHITRPITQQTLAQTHNDIVTPYNSNHKITEGCCNTNTYKLLLPNVKIIIQYFQILVHLRKPFIEIFILYMKIIHRNIILRERITYKQSFVYKEHLQTIIHL